MRRVNGRRATAVTLAALSLVFAAGAFDAPANALSGRWMLGYTDSTTLNPDFAQPGDVISSTTLDLSFTGQYMGSPASFDCSNVPTTGFRYTVPTPLPSGVPYAPMYLELDTPTTTVTGCVNSVDGGPVTLSFVAGSRWLWQIYLPPPGLNNGDPYTSSLSGEITVPDGYAGPPAGQGTVIVTAPTLLSDVPGQPCTFQWPAYDDLSDGASYGPGTGVLSKASNPFFDIDNGTDPSLPASQANCSAAMDWASLQSLSLTLENQNGKTPTLVWSP